MPKLANKSKNNSSKKNLKPGFKKKEHPRSYRFDPEIMNTLKETLKKINQISPKKISEARLMKALIWLSKDTEQEKILKALKEVW